MADYENMYFNLFNAMSRAPEALEEMHIGQATALLRQAQRDGEAAYMERVGA